MSDRAVSEVVSYVLVFALIVSAVGIISSSGLSTLQDVRNDEQISNAERAFDIMSNNIEDIHRRGAPSRATEISLGEAELTTGPSTTMRVYIDDDGSLDEVANTQFRPIIYTGEDDGELVYEAGAIFRKNRDGRVTVQEPPLLIDENRVYIPIIALSRPRAQSFGGSTVLVRTQLNERTVRYEDTNNNVNEIEIEISDSNNNELWITYFESQGFDCGGPSGDVECTFPDPPSNIDAVYIVEYDISVNIEP